MDAKKALKLAPAVLLVLAEVLNIINKVIEAKEKGSDSTEAVEDDTK